MKKILVSSILLLLTNMSFSQTFVQAYSDIVNQVSQTNVTSYLTEFEALGIKRRGTQPLEDTYNWLVNKYLSYGYVSGQMQEDTFTDAGYTCKNLIVTKVGTVYPNTYVIVCGHYDSIGGTGTNDNGSGTVTILEAARLLQNVDTEYSIKFIHFSGEEDGLVGSQHYVNNVVNATTPKMDIRLVFNIDEVGGVAGVTNNTITCERDTGNPTTNNAASTTVTNELMTCVGLYSSLNANLSYAYASDYMPFEDNNEIITGFYETNESTHPHSSTDLFVNMDPVYNYNVAKAATGAILHFAIATTALSGNTFDNPLKVSFFPNPVKDYLNINFGTLTNKKSNLKIIDSNGRIVLEQNFENPKVVENICITDLSKGMYLVKLGSGDQFIQKKIIIQ
ncbi:leucyl aminopeptidase [Flavobacterium sediminis]|uniref:Leucyl aminopeptidase n=1 Tax=Flavobacterium sediminis TaxID=2201181 RepID=A0A2U8QX40_9FLAO|nr:M28 family peptidase [Flavobacterium sediminis]AWM14703.1 leucyl aminopeptidase [Flavobacterium sediminis]